MRKKKREEERRRRRRINNNEREKERRRRIRGEEAIITLKDNRYEKASHLQIPRGR